MELEFDEYFSESHNASKDDFDMGTNSIKSYYKAHTEPPAIRIELLGNDLDKFLKEKTDPRISLDSGVTYMYLSIEKTINKIK